MSDQVVAAPVVVPMANQFTMEITPTGGIILHLTSGSGPPVTVNLGRKSVEGIMRALIQHGWGVE